ncbi:CBS domain-containing protein [Amycolatopsis benzoatilytica]|uniref:CBS domain-containing protein n=1 Tax=Amycolatopsis benzoatilytica TaxID=346045 RepID=UPI00036F504F|nr:CBS domain-containing protein [Amycolatopsis benzoatilytica]
MSGLLVSDLMSWPVVTAAPDLSFKELADVLAKNGIAAVPVVDSARRPIGVVTESALLARYDRRSAGPEPSVFASRAHRRLWAQAHGRTAVDVMETPVHTVRRDEPLAAAARWMVEAKLRRLFVVDGFGALVGVLARRDVLAVFLRPDAKIKEMVERSVLQQALWANPAKTSVRVDDGVVTLAGTVDSRSEALRAEQLTEVLPGVVGVRNRLDYARDGQEEAGVRR